MQIIDKEYYTAAQQNNVKPSFKTNELQKQQQITNK